LFADLRGYDPDPGLRVDPGQALEGFLRAVGVPGEHVPPVVEDRSRLLRSLLAAYAPRGRRVLVVADNVSTSGQAASLLPSDGACAAIVTSRHVLADLDARLLNLDALTTDQAVELLEAALLLRDPADSRVRDHPGDAERLVVLCAGLPLAVQIVAAQLAASPAKPLAAIAADLDDVASRLAEMAFADRAVHAVFDTSYQQLPDDQARLFRLLSLNPGPDVSTPAVAALSGLLEAEARRGLEALARAHLIEPSAPYGRWRMHDLLRLHSAHHGTTRSDADQRDQALTRLLDHYLTITRAASAHLDPVVKEPSRLGFSDRQQALAWLDGEYDNLTAATLRAEEAGHPAIACDLPMAMSRFMEWRRHFNDWTLLAHAALHAARTLDDRSGQAYALSTLGSALHEVRRFDEAITAHQDAVQIFRDIGDREGEGSALNNLGGTLAQMGRFDEAISAHQQDLQICRDADDRHGEGIALNNLGLALHEWRRFDEAITAYEDAVQIFRDIGDRQHEGGSLDNFGLTLRKVERFEEAITAHQQGLQICRDTDDRYGEAKTLSCLGIVLGDVGRFDEATAALHDGIQIFHEFGDDHNETRARDELEEILLARDAVLDGSAD
jgi:tetratricopeptide (TPR) repeat protein